MIVNLSNRLADTLNAVIACSQGTSFFLRSIEPRTHKRASDGRSSVLWDEMLQSFSTDSVPVSDRLEAWRWQAQQICGASRFHFPKRLSFHGSIEARRVAKLELTLFSSSPLSFEKFPVVSPHSENRLCIVITQLAGVRRYCQDGKTAILKRGDTTLIDSGRPWSSDCEGDCTRLYLRVPYRLMEEKLHLPLFPIARRISGASGLGTFLFGLFTSLFRQTEHLTSDQGTTAIEAYLKILSACVRDAEGIETNRWTSDLLFSRILVFVGNHLAEPDLGPATIASAMGISVRHVHRVFSHRGCSIADWIRTHRLIECQRDLSDPQQRQKSITDISFSWGFNDSAHFSRSFKKQFGICPRVYRSELCTSLLPRDHDPSYRANVRHLQPN
jgi:AraC family transcriptional regulator, positive regulator of tynA and feaB